MFSISLRLSFWDACKHFLCCQRSVVNTLTLGETIERRARAAHKPRFFLSFSLKTSVSIDNSWFSCRISSFSSLRLLYSTRSFYFFRRKQFTHKFLFFFLFSSLTNGTEKRRQKKILLCLMIEVETSTSPFFSSPPRQASKRGKKKGKKKSESNQHRTAGLDGRRKNL